MKPDDYTSRSHRTSRISPRRGEPLDRMSRLTSHLPADVGRGRPARGASHDDHGGDRLRQLRRRGRDTALASSGEPGRAAHELCDRLTAKTERADASIRQDLYEAAWRRLQPLRRSSPRGRPRGGYSATEPATRPGRPRRAAAGSLRRQASTKRKERRRPAPARLDPEVRSAHVNVMGRLGYPFNRSQGRNWGHGSPGEGCFGCLKSWSPAN